MYGQYKRKMQKRGILEKLKVKKMVLTFTGSTKGKF